MKVLVKRIAKREKYTIGRMYIDDVYIADTLEDRDRSLSSDMPVEEIKKIKVYGETAIPTGTYKLNMNVVSPKFKNRSWATPYNGKIPRLENVKGFDGVLIHVLNSADESYGCLGVGENKVVGKIINSTATFHKVMKILLSAKDDIYITIE